MSATSIGELEAQIDAAPDDDALYAVYGDLLARRGDPRGELIALQLAAQAQTGKAADKLRALATKYLATHAAALLGPLAADASALTWRAGFIRRFALPPAPGRSPVPSIERLLRHPSGRFLVELGATVDDPAAAELLLRVLAQGAPGSLRDLALVARAELDIAALLAAVPRLARLSLTGLALDLGEPGALALPALQRLALVAATLTTACVLAVARAPWPQLERLELRFGSHAADPATFADVRQLLARTDLPALTHLKLRNVPFAGAIVRELVYLPLTRQLHVLDLSHGSMSPADAAVVLANPAAFAHLRELWLPMRHLRPADRTALAALGTHVVSDQRAVTDQTEKLLGLE